MKSKKEKSDNTSINNLKIETVETKPEDGFVKTKKIRPVKLQHYGKDNITYHKGYAKVVSYTTDDPRITRPFAYSICGIFLLIGIFILLIGHLLFGIIFIFIGLFGLNKSKKNIDKVANILKSRGCDVRVGSNKEKKQLKEKLKFTMSRGIESVTNIFTQNNFNSFIKSTMPIFCIVAAVTVLLISIFANIVLGLFVLIILGVTGLLYYYLISKLFKK